MSASEKAALFGVLVKPLSPSRAVEVLGPLEEQTARAYADYRSEEEWNEVSVVALRQPHREEFWRAGLRPDELPRGLLLSADADRVVCGLVQPSEACEPDEVEADAETWSEVRRAFPLSGYRVQQGSEPYDLGEERYGDADAMPKRGGVSTMLSHTRGWFQGRMEER